MISDRFIDFVAINNVKHRFVAGYHNSQIDPMISLLDLRHENYHHSFGSL